jgi:hypothetical protein
MLKEDLLKLIEHLDNKDEVNLEVIELAYQPTPYYIERQTEEEKLYGGVKGYSSVSNKKAVYMVANNANWFCNWEHPLEGRDHHWELVEWLNS